MTTDDPSRHNAARQVRSTLHRLGYRFRLGREDLPGRPDLVLPRWRLAVFVVDCARHPHPGCPHPPTKADATANQRLGQDCQALARLGWETLVIQACDTADPQALAHRLDIAIQGRLIAKP